MDALMTGDRQDRSSAAVLSGLYKGRDFSGPYLCMMLSGILMWPAESMLLLTCPPSAQPI